MNAAGFRISVAHEGDAAAFVRVLATVVNPSPMYLASTSRLADGTTRCTFLLRHQGRAVSPELVDDVVARVASRYLWRDYEPLMTTGSPADTRPGVVTAA